MAEKEIGHLFSNMFFHLFLLSSSLLSNSSWGWGQAGHQIIAQSGLKAIPAQAFANCQIALDEIVQHTIDPDTIWKQKRREFPNEGRAHFYHFDQRAENWKTLPVNTTLKNGFLIYRILHWLELATKARQQKNYVELKKLLIGLSHYVGDLVQPLHLTSDHDGQKAGISGIHNQFETKMVNRFQKEIQHQVEARLKNPGVTKMWSAFKAQDLIFDTAEQSFHRVHELTSKAKLAQIEQKSHVKNQKAKKRFVKKLLWKETGEIATQQMAQGARLWGFLFQKICL